MTGSDRLTTQALKSGIGLAEDWGLLAFSGPDAQSFLQGYFTADVERLSTDQATPTAICNLKGRVVANGWAWLDCKGQVLWLVHRTLTESVVTFLGKYLAFAKAEVSNITANFTGFCALGSDLPTTSKPNGTETISLTDGLTAIYVPADKADEWWASQSARVTTNDITQRLIAGATPVIEHSTSEKYLPQMLNLPALGAVDFDKGCYLGQEVVARAEHRGAVKRSLVRLQGQLADSTDEAATTELTDADGKTCGEIIMQCETPDQLLALAVVRSNPATPLTWQSTQLDLVP